MDLYLHVLWICRSRSSVDTGGIEIHEGTLELGIVKDALEDGLVFVHPPHDGSEECAVEDQSEVVKRVIASLSGDFRVSHPGFLKLFE